MEWIEKFPIAIQGHQARVFMAKVPDGALTVMVAREPLGPKGGLAWHLSISHIGPDLNPGRIPVWDEIKEARYKFCPDGVDMAMILPPKAEYVNVHPTTMHLHEI